MSLEGTGRRVARIAISLSSFENLDFQCPYDCAKWRVHVKSAETIRPLVARNLEGARRATGRLRATRGDDTPGTPSDGGEMINNTSFAHWSRLQAKSLDAQFKNEMITGLNCSPFEAEAIVEKVHEIYAPLLDTAQGLKPGQIQIMVIDASVAPNVPLTNAKQRLVTLTLHAGETDIEARKNGSVPEVRRKRLCRMCQETFQQGGLLTLDDLANLFNCGVRTLVNDLAALRKENIVPPLRSTIKDMGRAITHRRLIITLWMQGFEYSEIARKACHSVDSVGNYVDKFKRCAALFASGFDVHTVALMVKLSTPLTQEFQEIYTHIEGVPHRIRELEEFLKKNRGQEPKHRSRP